MRMHTRWWISVCALWLFVASVTHAQVSASDKAAAEALFDRGLALMREGKLDEACSRLEQSNSIERGIGTMLYLAECYEKQGRTASAWAVFREASSQAQAAGQFERATAGRQRAEKLEPTLSKLTVEVPDAVRVQGLEVTRNGAPLAPGLWGVPLPVDPGRLIIEARAPGYHASSHTLNVEAGPHQARYELTKLTREPEAEVAQAPRVTAPVEVAPPAQPAPAPIPVEHGLNKAKLAGLIIGGAGAALLVVGAGFGGRAIKQNNIANDNCLGNVCDRKGFDASENADSAAMVANVGIIGGAALLVGGALTYFLAPKSETRVAVNADGRSVGLSVGGVF
jgi:tetratricopeptide (TPR) repeat protein